MSRQTFRLNLLASEFPLVSDNYGRSIVLPQQDMHYVRPNAFTGSEADRNIGIPQLIFCENVMPASWGLQSIGYTLAVNSAGVGDFDDAIYLRDATDNRTLFSPGVTGVNAKRYTYNATTQVWSTSPIVVPSGAKCTVANIKTRTIVKFAFDTSFYEWTGVWAAFVIPALVPANILGVVAANAYLICYDRNTIYWSATNDITDFVPSLVTGAGSQRALSIKGDIRLCLPIDDGFIIYTTLNVVVAKYSGNTRFPWVYKEVKNSAGLLENGHACAAGENNNYYQYSTNGLMLNSLTKSEQKFTPVNEFLGQRYFETWNPATRSMASVALDRVPNVRIQFVANRWLVISYGNAVNMSFALIWDSALQRWGKLKISHVDCFEYFGDTGSTGTTQTVTWAQLVGTWAQQIGPWSDYGSLTVGGASSLTVPYKSLAFLQADGAVRVVNFDRANINDDSVAIIGKIQFQRNNLFEMHEVLVEGMGNELQSKLLVQSCIDGYNVSSSIYPSKTSSAGKFQKWNMKLCAINHNLVFTGNFDFKTIIAWGKQAGKR